MTDKNYFIIAITIIVCSFFGYIYFLYSLTNEEKLQIKVDRVEVIKDTLPELTLDNVLIELIKQDVKHPLIVLKQVIWETGHLKCKNCSLDSQNIFGYGWNGRTYHKYNHWIESIKAYKIYQLKYYKGGDYYQFLEDVGYAESQAYCNNLRSIKL